MLQGNETDEDLMTLYQEGSEEAFAALYARHSGKIFGYLKARVRAEPEATDLFQEVFVKIHRSKHLYNRTLPVLPWIFSVTHSVLIDGIRKSERRHEVFGVDFDQMPGRRTETETPSASITPLLNELPSQQQVALQMRYIDEQTFEEIATSLKTSPVNVRQMISRGVKNIKKLMKNGEKP